MIKADPLARRVRQVSILFMGAASMLALAGCSSIEIPGIGSSPPPDRGDLNESLVERPGVWQVEIIGTQTIEGVGAARGVAMHDGLVYVYGAGATGIVREYDLIDYPTTELSPTGRFVRLTRGGEDWISHPTGLAINPELGVWMGDSVNEDGILYLLDWDRMWEDGTLDEAVRHSVIDDAAQNGSRPEWVRAGRGWALASADSSAEGGALRLYDPRRLARASRTSSRGVVIANMPCGPYVQTLEWLDATDELMQVQTIENGAGYRLTTSTINSRALAAAAPVDLPEPTDKLVGFVWVAGEPDEAGVGIMVSSSATDNVTFVRLVRRSSRGGRGG